MARYRRRAHGKVEEIDPLDLDPYFRVPEDAMVGSPSNKEVVFVGPVGVGKTTSIQTLSSTMTVNTEVPAANPHEFIVEQKTTTTVGIDYGIWDQPDGTRVGLIGTAGQERFSSGRTALNNPEAGIALWLYGQVDALEEQIQHWLSIVGNAAKEDRLVVALNFAEPGCVEHAQFLLAPYGDVPCIIADPRDREDVAKVVTIALRKGVEN